MHYDLGIISVLQPRYTLTPTQAPPVFRFLGEGEKYENYHSFVLTFSEARKLLKFILKLIFSAASI